MPHRLTRLQTVLVASLVCAVFGAGCHSVEHHAPQPCVNVIPPQANMPRELCKIALPPYVIEPPDVVQINVIRAVPKPPYRIAPQDVLLVQASGTLPDSPVGGPFAVQPGGTINLGLPYGSVEVAGLTLEEATAKVDAHLRRFLRTPQVIVTLGEMAATQQISGEHLVYPDGTVALGIYGSVPVVGLTLAQAKGAIEAYLSQFLQNPEVSLEMLGLNSKAYYVITQGAGLGDGVTRFPVTGNETVLDAIANINGLQYVSSTKIWIARPSRNFCQEQVIPVDWRAVTSGGSAATNYQIMPGDRVFVAQDHLVAFDTVLGKITAPIERVLGVTLLGGQTVARMKNLNTLGGGGGF